MLVDTHCHLDGDVYQDDLDQVILRSKEVGVEKLVTIGVDVPSNRRGVEIVKKYPDVYRCVGFHPEVVSEDGFSEGKIGVLMNELELLLQGERVVGIGESGLDYYHLAEKGCSSEELLRLIELQKDLFERQILISLKYGLPLSLHVRDTGEQAYSDTLQILTEYFLGNNEVREYSFSISDLSSRYDDGLDARVVGEGRDEASLTRGVLHCVSGPVEYVHSAIELGFMVGVCGNITFKNAQSLREMLKEVPLEHMVLETDAPFLAPGSRRGKRNEPSFLVETAKCLAEIKGVNVEEVERVTSENAGRLFGLSN